MEDGQESIEIELSHSLAAPEKNSPLMPEALMQLASNLGNDETKLITIAAMEPGVYYGQRPLARKVESFLGGVHSPYVGKSIYKTFCERSFQQIGLVDVREGQWHGKPIPEFCVTRYGNELATSLSGHLLEFSQRYPDVSLQDLMGSTKSSAIDSETGAKKTAPEIRYRMYYELLTAQLPMRVRDLATALGEQPKALKRHLDELDAEEILHFRSADSLGPVVEYRINEAKPIPEGFSFETKYPELTREIYDLVRTLTENDDTKWVSIRDAIDNIPMRTTGMFKGSDGFDTTRSVVLRNLANDGYLVRREFDGLLKSTISLSPEQRQMILEFITIFDTFKNQNTDYIQAGIQKVNAILSDPTRVYALMEKAKEHSHQADQVTIDLMKEIVLGAMQPDKEVQAKELLKPIKENSGKKIGRVHLREVMGKMVEDGTLMLREDNNRKYWRLAV